jgi:ATP-dependent DNA ligase
MKDIRQASGRCLIERGADQGLAVQAAPCHFPGMEWRTKPPAKRPGLIEPCIPTRAEKPPVGPQWIHEIKHAGYRLIARKRDGRVTLFTRNGFDWTERYPLIRAAVAALRVTSAVVDGEAAGASTPIPWLRARP